MDEVKERDYEIMRTYARAWKTDIVMYHLFGVPLWFPFSLRQAGFFIVGLVFTFILTKIIPGIKSIPFAGDPVMLFGGYPFLIMKLFTQFTLDGKPPHVYFKDQIIYLFEDKRYNMYQPIYEEIKIKYSQNPVFRVLNVISSIDYRMLRKEAK